MGCDAALGPAHNNSRANGAAAAGRRRQRCSETDSSRDASTTEMAAAGGQLTAAEGNGRSGQKALHTAGKCSKQPGVCGTTHDAAAAANLARSSRQCSGQHTRFTAPQQLAGGGGAAAQQSRLRQQLRALEGAGESAWAPARSQRSVSST
jgi:hypothetical protein